MAWSYGPLWKILIDRNMKKTDLLQIAGIYSQSLAKMGKGEAVSLDTIGKLCAALNCNVEDIIVFVPDDQVAEK